MKKYKTAEYINMINPTPGEFYRSDILTNEDAAKDLGGMIGLLVPGSQVPYHYHERRESILIFISGEGTEIVEGEEFSVKAGDVLFIPAGEKHGIINRSDNDLRYLEFYTCPPGPSDFIVVEEGLPS